MHNNGEFGCCKRTGISNLCHCHLWFPSCLCSSLQVARLQNWSRLTTLFYRQGNWDPEHCNDVPLTDMLLMCLFGHLQDGVGILQVQSWIICKSKGVMLPWGTKVPVLSGHFLSPNIYFFYFGKIGILHCSLQILCLGSPFPQSTWVKELAFKYVWQSTWASSFSISLLLGVGGRAHNSIQ